MRAFPATPYTVKVLGRAINGNGILWLTHSGTGIQFNTVAKAVAITLVGDETSVQQFSQDTESRARYAVYLDGKLIASDIMKTREQRIIVYNDKTQIREGKISIIKLSEARKSLMGIKNIITDDGGFVVPETRRDMQIEFIGDSITCGYGVESKTQNETFSTATENITKSFAYITAENFNADATFVCYSSYGVLSGWNEEGSKDEEHTLPKIYEYTAVCDNSKLLKEHKWKFTSQRPSIVVINLGTNDEAFVKKEPANLEDFKYAYIEFIRSLRKKYSDAYIVCTLGMMKEGDYLFTEVEKAVQFYVQDTKDRKVYSFHFTPATEEEGSAAGGHPSIATHARCARELTTFIKKSVLKIEQ